MIRIIRTGAKWKNNSEIKLKADQGWLFYPTASLGDQVSPWKGT